MKLYNRKEFLNLPSGTVYWEINVAIVAEIKRFSKKVVPGVKKFSKDDTLNIKLENNDDNTDFLHIPLVAGGSSEGICEAMALINLDSDDIDLAGQWNRSGRWNSGSHNYYIALEKEDWENIKKLVDKVYE